MDTFLSLCVGVGLAAACGFRVFVPLLVMSIASLSGHLTLAPSFQWIASYPALITFGVATVLEISAYYVPWLDNFLDTVASPAAVVAGTVVAASMVAGLDPFLQWTLAAIGGGGAAALVQAGSVLTRAASTAATGGLANPVVATAELGLSATSSVVWIFLPPLIGLLFLAALAAWAITKLRRRPAPTDAPPVAS